MSTNLYEFTAKDASGADHPLSKYKGEVMLIVNVASKCGFTTQYTGLEKLQKDFGPRGFHVLGFPCNQFGAQEPGNDQEIQSFCQLTYDVTFPVLSRIEVNGPNTAPIYEHLKASAPGLLGTEAIKWNFTKFLIGKNGKVLNRYAPQTKPEEIATDIAKALES